LPKILRIIYGISINLVKFVFHY